MPVEPRQALFPNDLHTFLTRRRAVFTPPLHPGDTDPVAPDISVPGCPFCDIVAERLPASVVYADDLVQAFLDIRPITTGHVLVVPRSHAGGLADLPERAGRAMFTAAQRMAAALRGSKVRCDGINFFLADGTVAGQEVEHVHLHVVPRFAGDGFRLSANFLSPDRADLDATAELIRGALDRLPG
jgi:histidine triad (HIT) family protein